MLASFQTTIDRLASRSLYLVDALLCFLLLVLISACVLILLKKIGFFEIKDEKTNEEIAEADTDFYKKNVPFAISNNENQRLT
jgi:hypothetical protein